MLGAMADGTTVQLAFDVTEAYTVRQTQQRAYHTAFVILIAIGAAVPVLLSSLGASVKGKRTAYVYLLIDIIGALVWGVVFFVAGLACLSDSAAVGILLILLAAANLANTMSA